MRFYQQPIARVSTELVLSILAVIFFAVFAIRPTLITMTELIKEIEDKQELEQLLQRKVAALSTAQDEYQRLKPKLNLLDQAIPSQINLLESLKIIEKVASDERVIISSIVMGEIPGNENMNEPLTVENLARQDYAVKLSVLGDYPAIKQFATRLNQARRTFVVSSVSFKIEDQQQTETLKADLTVVMPYFSTKNAQPKQEKTTKSSR